MFDMIMMLICTTYVISHDFSLVCKESVKVKREKRVTATATATAHAHRAGQPEFGG